MSLVTAPNALFQWHSLVKEASKESLIDLSEEVESYLVFLLMRFSNRPEITQSVLGQEYWDSLKNNVPAQRFILQEVGDKCLLLTGLFPARCRRKRVKTSYFVKLGQNAYTVLGKISPQEATSGLYISLSEAFIPMVDVLQTTRELERKVEKDSFLDLLETYEFWCDTKSTHALKILQKYTNNPILKDDFMTRNTH